MLSSVKHALTRRRRAATVIAAALLTAGAGLTFAPSASADPFRCPPDVGSDSQSLCAHVIKINPGSSLTVRSGPGSGYSNVGSLPNGAIVEVECWTYGTPVSGYTIWTRLYSAGGARYVSDYYLDTGRVQSFLPQC
ncbi:SH3 domain-containing protein [Streptomyces griseorubiginosus]|uniref:SH3 domain-containing protein n=1 Tax=Streptomyces griseorubiginosus TaxID=67304 RepID=UPI0033ABEE36